MYNVECESGCVRCEYGGDEPRIGSPKFLNSEMSRSRQASLLSSKSQKREVITLMAKSQPGS